MIFEIIFDEIQIFIIQIIVKNNFCSLLKISKE